MTPAAPREVEDEPSTADLRELLTELNPVQVALRQEEMHRFWMFALWAGALALAGVALVPFSGGDPGARRSLLVCLCVLLAAALWAHRAHRRGKGTIEDRDVAALGLAAVVTSVMVAYYAGVFSPLTVITGVGIVILGQGSRTVIAWGIPLGAVAGWCGLLVATWTGSLRDVGLVPLASLPRAAAGLFGVIVPLAFLLSFGLARGSRRGEELAVARASRAFERLARHNDRILAALGDAVYEVRTDGTLAFVNAALLRMTGYQSGELLGQSCHDRLHTTAAPATCRFCGAWGGERFDAAVRRRDGTELRVEVVRDSTSDESPATGSVVAFRDVSDRLALARAKSEFLTLVSHELRTPVASLRGALGLLSDGAERNADEDREMLALAARNSARLARLVDDIVELELLEAFAEPPTLRSTALSQVLRAAASQVRELAESAGVEVRIQETSAWIQGEARRLTRATVDLLTNAVTHSPRGSRVTVTVDEHELFHEVRVADAGPDVSADHRRTIFDSFSQTEDGDGRQRAGSGLGLAICRAIVHRHGGEVGVEGSSGSGSTFWFRVPRAEPVRPGEAAHVAVKP
jgi:PAS domain S-box-containing protein